MMTVFLFLGEVWSKFKTSGIYWPCWFISRAIIRQTPALKKWLFNWHFFFSILCMCCVCMRDTWAPPVDLCAPPVLYGSLWPPCTGWCPGSTHSHLSRRGGWGSVFQWESAGCWSLARLGAHEASTDDCHNAWPWNAQIPRSDDNPNV